MPTRLLGPTGDIIGNPPHTLTWDRYFPDGVVEPPPPFEVATRPWIGSSAPEGLTGFNRLQNQIVKRELNLRTVFYSSFTDDLSGVLPDIQAGRVPSISMKEPDNPADWADLADAIVDLNAFILLTVRHEPENDAGYTYTDFEVDFSDMYSTMKPIVGDLCWMGPVYMAVTASSPTRQGYRDLLDTMTFDIIQCDGYNQLYKRSFSQIFNWFALKARSRTDLNTDPLIAGVPWAVRETSVHGTDVQRSNWVKSAQVYWEKPENRDLVAVNWFDSEVGDNAAIVGWRMEKALPVGWYAQPIPPATKPVARAAPPFDPEYVEDLLTPAAVASALATNRRPLGPVIPPVEPPPEPPQYGALALGETNYPIPTDLTLVKFCGPNGVDTGAGTEANPYRTLQKAVNECPQGGTVVMRGGEYPEQVGGKWRTDMTIQAYPGEAPILYGSDVTTGWILDITGPGGTDRWRKSNIDMPFDETPQSASIVNPSWPESVKPYQVWIDDVPLQQVGSLAAVDATAPDEAGAPGTFWYDKPAKILWIGSTPFNKTVRVTRRQTAFTGSQSAEFGHPRVDLKGIGVFHYGTSSLQFGAVRLYAPDTLVEHCHIIGNSNAGIFLNRTVGAKLLHNTMSSNGLMAVRGFHAELTEQAFCKIEKNNRKYFATDSAAGGEKFDTYSVGLKIHHNYFNANIGHGCWLDIQCALSVVYRNEFRNHTVSSGMFWELGTNAMVCGNYFRGNRYAMLAGEAGAFQLWNNTFVDNTYHYAVHHGDRPDGVIVEGATLAFDQVNFECRNNVFCQEIADNNVRMLEQTDPHGGTLDYIEVNWTADYDAFWWDNNQGLAKVATLLTPTGQVNYDDASDLPGTLEDNCLYDDTSTTNPYLQSDRMTPIALGPLIGTGTPAPAIVADLLEWDPETIETPNRGWL